MSADLELLGLLVLHLLLTALPAAAAVLVAMRAGLDRVPLLLAVALAGSGIGAILVFWGFYLDPLLGQVAAFVLVLGSIQGIVLARPDRLDRGVLRQLATPAALWALGTGFVLFLGFVHGGTDEPLGVSTTRFSHPLPGDNLIPIFFSDWFFEREVGGVHYEAVPMFGDWLSSDRPPLQIGYVLAQRPFGWDENGLHYQVLAVVIQQLWIVGMWAVLYAARIRPLARGLAILAAMVSDVAIVHGFFVWPKLIAAAFLLGALELVISKDWERLRTSALGAGLFAALCGLAMLAHGASAFGVLPLLVLAALRGWPSWRWLGTAAVVGLALLGPWTAYQRYADPPGDRLVKWHLGGSLEIDDRGAVEAIVDGYEEAGFDATVGNKWHNVITMVGWTESEGAIRAAADWIGAGEPGETAAALRLPRFFSLLPFLGLLLIAPIAMIAARARGRVDNVEWRFAWLALAICLLTSVVWVLLMFGGPEAAATLHVGTLVLPLLAVCACVVGAYSVSRAFAIGLTAANALLVLALYVPVPTPPPESSVSALAALLATASLFAFALVALRPSGR